MRDDSRRRVGRCGDVDGVRRRRGQPLERLEAGWTRASAFRLRCRSSPSVQRPRALYATTMRARRRRTPRSPCRTATAAARTRPRRCGCHRHRLHFARRTRTSHPIQSPPTGAIAGEVQRRRPATSPAGRSIRAGRRRPRPGRSSVPVVATVGHPELGAVPRHLRMAPGQPRKPRSVGTESRRRVEVVAGRDDSRRRADCHCRCREMESTRASSRARAPLEWSSRTQTSRCRRSSIAASA